MNQIKTNIKMRVTPEQSEKIQKICFENGNGWTSGKILNHLDKPYLYLNRYSELGYTDINSELYFINDTREEVLADLFIRTNGTCIETDNIKGY